MGDGVGRGLESHISMSLSSSSPWLRSEAIGSMSIWKSLGASSDRSLLSSPGAALTGIESVVLLIVTAGWLPDGVVRAFCNRC